MDIETLPKAELHCHLDGVLDAAMVRELAAEGVVLPLEAEELAAVSPVRDFASFMAWFAVQAPLSKQFALYQHIAGKHVERLKAQRVVYTELFIPSLSLDVVEALDQLHALRAVVNVREGGVIQVEFMNAWSRDRSLERVEPIATRNIGLFEAGLLCGVALAGPERGYPVSRLARVFDRYHEAGVPVEIHAGEWCGPESVWDALEHGHPRRIGHGTHALEDPRLVETLIERGIHVEMCPTSNVCTDSVASLGEHPIRRAFDLGLDLSVNSDDPGAFGCSTASEYALLADHFGFTPDELRRLTINAIRARFQTTMRVRDAAALQ